MKTLAYLTLALLLATDLAGCGGASAAAGVTPTPIPQAISGLSTPKSVSVVTAN